MFNQTHKNITVPGAEISPLEYGLEAQHRGGSFVMENYDLFNQPTTNDIEIWEDLKGYEGLYKISTFGRIKSIAKNKILPQKVQNSGYLLVWVHNKNVRKACTVHRLVAINFVPNPNNYPQVNHIDGDKYNNKKSNLEWCTQSQNMRHAVSTGLASLDHLSLPVLKICILTGAVLARYKSSVNAIKDGYKNSAISMCLRGTNRTAYGFKWVYENGYNKNTFVSPLKELYDLGKNVNKIISYYPMYSKEQIMNVILPLPEEQIDLNLK